MDLTPADEDTATILYLYYNCTEIAALIEVMPHLNNLFYTKFVSVLPVDCVSYPK